jgi:hypothetical protein
MILTKEKDFDFFVSDIYQLFYYADRDQSRKGFLCTTQLI